MKAGKRILFHANMLINKSWAHIIYCAVYLSCCAVYVCYFNPSRYQRHDPRKKLALHSASRQLERSRSVVKCSRAPWKYATCAWSSEVTLHFRDNKTNKELHFTIPCVNPALGSKRKTKRTIFRADALVFKRVLYSLNFNCLWFAWTLCNEQVICRRKSNLPLSQQNSNREIMNRSWCSKPETHPWY